MCHFPNPDSHATDPHFPKCDLHQLLCARPGIWIARGQHLRLLRQWRRTSRLAFQETANSLIACQKIGEIIAEGTKLVTSQKSVSAIALDRFQGGASSYLEVLDAERELFSGELDLADARSNRLRTVVQAYRALGGGWK